MPKDKKFSEAAARDDTGAPRCPKCGGTNFTAHRSTGTKLGLGVLALLTPKSETRCVTCGWTAKVG